MNRNDTRTNWRYLTYTAATLATFLLAAGAKWKNH